MSGSEPEGKVLFISAVTLATHDMARAVDFYARLGFRLHRGGPGAAFSTFALEQGYLNLIAADRDKRWAWWGRVILYVRDVDALHRDAVGAGLRPEMAPSDAPWGERYFHILDPDGHELSFAQPLVAGRRPEPA